MRYLSVCSGIEAATVAWHSLGWEAAAFSEIEKFPRAVLQHHYPNVPLHGDFTTIGAEEYGPIDLLVGGTPCQSFSVAGLRAGLDDDRGNLALEFLRLAERTSARWVVWENVPGVLSSNGGRDFGSILGGLVELGYGFAYRVLDAQFFGVAQRRRRVFVVGCAGSAASAAAVLFERHSLQGHFTPCRETREGIAKCLTTGVGQRYDPETETLIGGWDYENNAHGPDDPTGPLLKGSPTGGGRPLPAIAFGWQNSSTQGDSVSEHITPTLDKSKTPAIMFRHFQDSEFGCQEYDTAAIRAGRIPEHSMILGPQSSAVRRLTPVECERLQGFPDVKNCAIIRVCQNEDERQGIARSAALSSAVQNPAPSVPVAVDVLIDLERSVLQIHSLGRSALSVSNAADANWSHLRMPQGDFVRHAALMTQTLAQITRDGAAASQPNIKSSSHHLNGSALVLLSGQEIAALANDAERFTTALDGCTKSITSERGSSSPNYGSTLEILASCVSAAISGFIPPAMKGACSFEIRLTTSQGYTAIPWRGKEPAVCPDGPRYKALGNSMAVPVMSWIGERIDQVEAIAQEQAA